MSTEERKPNIPSQIAQLAAGKATTASLKQILADKHSDYQSWGSSTELFESSISTQTAKVLKQIRELDNSTSPVTGGASTRSAELDLDERLFDARASVKILFSSVSMHFSKALREKLFYQIDLLHDCDDWEEGDESIQIQSFNTFLRWYFLNDPQRIPSFGMTSKGLFIASWLANANKDRLILEYLSSNRIRWFVTKYYDDELDRSSGLTTLSRIAGQLACYQLEGWFTEDSKSCI